MSSRFVRAITACLALSLLTSCGGSDDGAEEATTTAAGEPSGPDDAGETTTDDQEGSAPQAPPGDDGPLDPAPAENETEGSAIGRFGFTNNPDGSGACPWFEFADGTRLIAFSLGSSISSQLDDDGNPVIVTFTMGTDEVVGYEDGVRPPDATSTTPSRVAVSHAGATPLAPGEGGPECEGVLDRGLRVLAIAPAP